MAKKYRLQDVAQLRGRDIFIDANILIYLFWPTGQHTYEARYARVYSHLLRQKNTLFVDFLIISEVINRILRNEHQRKNPNEKFKNFRSSQEGIDTLNDIYIIVKDQILTHFNVIGKAFAKQDIESFLAIDDLDFVDKATVAICKDKDLVLLTSDRDFKNVDLDILTDNPYILS